MTQNADSQGLNSVEGFVAGAFVKTTTLTPCPDLESAEYQEEAVHHINKFDSTRPSKFISFTKK